MYAYRVNRNVAEESSVIDTAALGSQQLILQHDHTYSIVDDTQGDNDFMVSSNLAYGAVAEHSRQPVPQDDLTYIYCAVDSSHQETIETSENPGYGTTLGTATSAK